VRLKEIQDPKAFGSQPTDLPFQQSIPLDPSASKQDQEIQDLCREILMVRISKFLEPEDDSTERLNLDDYNSDNYDEYLSDNMETTPPAVTDAQVAIKQDPPAPPLAVTVTIELEEQPAAEDLYERHRLLNQERAFKRQRLANRQHGQQGDNYEYSNSDLRNVINIGRDACNVIISRRKESEEIEAYNPSSNYHIPAHSSSSFKKRKPASTLPQGKSHTQHHGETSLGGDKIKKITPTQVLHATKELSHDLQVQLTPQGPWGTVDKGYFTKNLVDYHIDYYYPQIFSFSHVNHCLRL
jgi:hypothetical protein